MSGRELTGRKVLIITVAFFAVGVGVNLTLAYQAVHTFPGLEVENGYVASQEFNSLRHEQVALGWTANVDYDEKARLFSLRFTDANGRPVKVPRVALTIGRATSNRDDKQPDLVYYNGTFSAPLDLGPGYWTIRLDAHAEDGTEFRQRLHVHVDG